MQLNNDSFWDAIFKSILLACCALSGLYLVTQPDTLTAIIGLSIIGVVFYQSVNFLTSLINKKQPKTTKK